MIPTFVPTALAWQDWIGLFFTQTLNINWTLPSHLNVQMYSSMKHAGKILWLLKKKQIFWIDLKIDHADAELCLIAQASKTTAQMLHITTHSTLIFSFLTLEKSPYSSLPDSIVYILYQCLQAAHWSYTLFTLGEMAAVFHQLEIFYISCASFHIHAKNK